MTAMHTPLYPLPHLLSEVFEAYAHLRPVLSYPEIEKKIQRNKEERSLTAEETWLESGVWLTPKKWYELGRFPFFFAVLSSSVK